MPRLPTWARAVPTARLHWLTLQQRCTRSALSAQIHRSTDHRVTAPFACTCAPCWIYNSGGPSPGPRRAQLHALYSDANCAPQQHCPLDGGHHTRKLLCLVQVSTSPGNGWLMARLADERGLVPESYVRRHELQPAVMCHDFDAEETAELSTRRGERLSIVASIAAPAGWTFVVRTHGSGAVGPGLVPCDWLIRSPAVRMRAAFQREVVGGQCGYPVIIASPITVSAK